ncbi:hypothetical protein [Streptomyces sp. AC512_CC834]|uniref:hypothetical protein n=1 Tax=Streptomyces sp. AC512_CC834 TaxID=2823691 RepID=UPI001C2593B2|nr:hypothetical protein [Streptomyces sp. AC512_CC834]
MRHPDPAHLPPVSVRGTAPESDGDGGVARAVLWVVLVGSVVGNTVASYTGAGTGVHLVAGAVTVLCATVLAVRRLRSGP